MILKLEAQSGRIFTPDWNDRMEKSIRDYLKIQCDVTIMAWNGWNENGYSKVQMILDAESFDHCMPKIIKVFELEKIEEVPDLNITGFKVTP